MSRAKLTVVGFYNYDNTLFDDFRLSPLINRDTLIDNIIIEGAEFEVLYSNYDFYKRAVNHFFDLNYDLFNKWAEDLAKEYEPLENYDRKEHWTDKFDGKEDTQSDSTSNDVSDGNTAQLNKTSSFDSNGLVNDSENTGNAHNEASNKSAATGKNLKDDLATHDGRIHGNIGVTTSQQMLESELELRQKWQLLKIITDMFLSELTIRVYD